MDWVPRSYRRGAPQDLSLTGEHDHTLVNRELKEIATTEGIAVSETLNSEFQARLSKLSSVSAADVDAAYIADTQELHARDEVPFANEATEDSKSCKTFIHEIDLIVRRHTRALHGWDSQ
jgi:predicted outer membrane protein